jgi:hypothetical protein
MRRLQLIHTTTRSSKSVSLISLSLLVFLIAHPSNAFSQQTSNSKGHQRQRQRQRHHPLYSRATPSSSSSEKSKPKKTIHVDFWGAKINNNNDDDDDDGSLPCIPTLDPFDGPLPPGAFGIQGPPETDPTRMCRVTTIPEYVGDDPDETVRRLEQSAWMRCRLVSNPFQLVPSSDDTQKENQDLSWRIGRLHSQTPPCAVES